MLWLIGAASAAEFWVGGGLAAGVAYEDGAVGAMATDSVSQVELDVTMDADRLTGGLEVDFHLDPAAIGWNDQIPVEALWVRYDGEQGYVRPGVFTPDMGLEGWDDWENYQPSFSAMWDASAVGRVLGVEVGRDIDEGGTVFVFGGADLDWSAPYDGYWEPTAGIGYSNEADAWGTWSGVYMRPKIEHYGVIAAVELYPHEKVWVSVDGNVSLLNTAPFASGQVMITALPETLVSPILRVEGVMDKQDVAGVGYNYAAGVGARVQPVDFARASVEAKMLVGDDGSEPAAYLTIDVFRPEPEE